MRAHLMKALSVVGLVVGLILVQASPAGANGGAPRRLTFSLQDGNTMAGFHYRGHRNPVLIMLHGASDTHTVFDFSPAFRTAARLADRGFTVLTVDRVGYGASSRPNGDTLDFTRQAGYVHEVVQAVRGGALGFTPGSVVLLGPSVGADLAMVEAGTFHDVDGVVVCFNTSELQPALFEVDVNAWFAQGDYFDFGTDFRTQFFYALPFAFPWTIALDNATRSLVPRAEIMSALMNGSAPFRAQITVPVFLLQADHDDLFVPRDDTALFTGSPDVTFSLLHFAGHKGFVHFTSHLVAVDRIGDWLSSRFSP
jgi:pimeloyl-ACP methyl ester carboxylesterase